MFGDAIAPRGGAVTLGSLIRLAAPFGLTERLVRTSVARLARDGWLVARRFGRRSEYRLTRERRASASPQATRRIYGANPRAWDGRWTLRAAAGGGAAAAADPPRAALARLRPADARALRPPGLHAGGRRVRGCATSTGRARRSYCAARARTVRVDRKLAARGWDLRSRRGVTGASSRASRRSRQRSRPAALRRRRPSWCARSSFTNTARSTCWIRSCPPPCCHATGRVQRPTSCAGDCMRACLRTRRPISRPPLIGCIGRCLPRMRPHTRASAG